jgi:hypothetical protein
MTTQEFAADFLSLYRAGSVIQIYDELYSKDIICKEPDQAVAIGVPPLTIGIDAVKAKSKARQELIAEVHSFYCSEPVVGGAHFSVAMGRDITLKNGQRLNLNEIAVYGVKEDKIVTETFFY